MTSARPRILARLLSAPGEIDGQAEVAPKRDQLSTDGNELLTLFRAALEAVHGEVHQVGADWPGRIATELAVAGLHRLWYGPESPLGAELQAGWPVAAGQDADPRQFPELIAFDHAIESCRETLFTGRDAGLTSALAGVAETGSLILWPTVAEPRSLSLVPEMHCVLLEREHIVSTLEHWMESFSKRQDASRLPTNLVIVTGPSKSADIEQTLTFGVHGPKRLLVFVRD